MKSYRGKKAFAFSNAKLSIIITIEVSLILYGKGEVLKSQRFTVSVSRDYDFFLILHASDYFACNSYLKKEGGCTSTF